MFIALPVFVAVLSAWNVIAFKLERLMDPRLPTSVSVTLVVALVVIAACLILAISGRKGGRRLLLALSLVVMVAAGFAPRALHAWLVQQDALQDQADGAEAEMEWQSALLDRSDDLDQRVADHNAYTAEEALDLAAFAADADLSGKGLMDHSAEAADLLRQAIQARILDPNLKGADGKSVTLAYYDKAIMPNLATGIRVHEYEVFRILADGGADLSAPEAAEMKATLARRAVPDASGRYLKLE